MTIAARPLPAARPRVEAGCNATLLGRVDVTASLATFTLRLDDPLVPFAAGQYVSVGAAIGERLLQRPYSVVSLTGGGRDIELFVKRLADGELSPRLWHLTPGTRLRVGRAKGLFKWTAGGSGRHVFVAAGTGIAPFVAMLDEARRGPDPSSVTIIHAASFADELAFGSRMQGFASARLRVDYRPYVSRPSEPRNDGWTGGSGRAEVALQQLLDSPSFDSQDAVAWLCGGGAMVDECARLLDVAGFSADRIRTEKFHLVGRDDVTR